MPDTGQHRNIGTLETPSVPHRDRMRNQTVEFTEPDHDPTSPERFRIAKREVEFTG
jgi:hypothetical protein